MTFTVVLVSCLFQPQVYSPVLKYFFKKRLSVILICKIQCFPILNLELFFFQKIKHLEISELL